MVDIKLIRTETAYVKEAVRKKGLDLDDTIDRLLQVDTERRAFGSALDAKKAEQNAVSKKLPVLRKNGEDVTELMARMKTLAAEIKQDDARLTEIEEEYQQLMCCLPNLPDDDLEAGGKENNKPVRFFGEQPVFDFQPSWEDRKRFG